MLLGNHVILFYYIKFVFKYTAAATWKIDPVCVCVFIEITQAVRAVAKPARQFSHAMQIFLCLLTIKGIDF